MGLQRVRHDSATFTFRGRRVLGVSRSSKKTSVRTSLVVWWLRILLLMQVSWVQTPVGELRSPMPQGN